MIYHTHLTLAQLPINPGDTLYNPGAGRDGSVAHSTVVGEPLYWSLGAWQKFPGNTVLTKSNGELVSLQAGTPVYVTTTGVLKRAMADQASAPHAIGLVLNPYSVPGDPTIVLLNGTLSTDIGAWSLITGQSGGLQVGKPYYLDTTAPGRLTTDLPIISGLWILQIGMAVSPTELTVDIKSPYQL